MASAAHAQASADPQAVAPVVYSGNQLTVENCNPNDPAYGDGCAANSGPVIDDHAPADYGYAPDYVPDYYADAPVYSAPVYLGISLLPDYYWGWPYYGYGYGYAYWPYYGYGCCWPYYGYAGYWGGSYWAGGYWGGHNHDHNHDHNHGGGDWGHGGGHGGGGHNGDYHGPYQYDGNGRYADQRGGTGGAGGTGGGRGGHGNPPAGTAARTMTATSNFSRPGTSTGADFSRAGTSTGDRNTFTGTSAGTGRTSVSPTNQISGANRFGGRAPLPSASYYAAARGDGSTRAAYAMNTRASAATANDRAGNGYAYGRGSTAANNAATNNRGANQSDRVASMPSRGYAPSSNRGGAVAHGGNIAPQNYAGSRSAYPQQRYAPSNRAYAHAGAPSYFAGGRGAYAGTRGTMPSYSGGRGAAPSYSGGRGAAPAYSHGGPGFASRGGGGGGSHAGSAATRSGGASRTGSSRGH